MKMPMDKCREFKKNVFELLDGTLETKLVNEMEEHLSECRSCQAFYEDEKDLKEETSTRITKAVDLELDEDRIDEITTKILELGARQSREPTTVHGTRSEKK